MWRAAPGRLLAEGAHGEIEQYLAASGLTATVLQASGFMQNFVTGAGAFTTDGDLVGAYGDGRISYIDCADIAACAAAALTDRARRVDRQGGNHVRTEPEALSHLDVAAGALEARTPAARELTGREPRSFARFLADNGHAVMRPV
ncbi:hypothetical protein GCM10009609_47950 [Pseudonocardia aurantiaca]|uniref:NmrA-like domain-containing protein n=1 Tax=Pseudonocardia aurantiaca TaxID=75290 RepID=A0ABW4FWE7_9PSEU